MTSQPVAVTKAVIPTAGLGTRFLPATKATPKEMLPVVDKPAIQYVVEEAVAAGLDDVLLVTGRNKRSLEDHFDRAWELEAVLEAKGDLDRLDRVQKSQVLADMRRRDQLDSQRDLAPLRPADDAVVIDTTDLSAEGVVEEILKCIEHARPV